ncbi:MAG: hypothetical protein ABH833_03055 [Parcubacteria group bacterium]
MKTSYLILLIVAIMILLVVLFFVMTGGSEDRDGDNGSADATLTQIGKPEIIYEGELYFVKYTDIGYSPQTVRIQKGDTVVFNNQSTQDLWTASDVHPTHTAYPNSGIEKCDLEESEREVVFDSCIGKIPGLAWTFTFDELGEWSYHNHLSPSHKGTIIVE